MKQRHLAEYIDLDPTYLNKIEKERRPPPGAESVLAIIEALRLDRADAEELLQLAGYAPQLLETGGELAYSSPALSSPHEPAPPSQIGFYRLFMALARLSRLPPATQRECIDAVISLIEKASAQVQRGDKSEIEEDASKR